MKKTLLHFNTLFFLFILFINLQASGQSKNHFGYLMPSDTVLMIKHCGGQMFFVEKNELLKCKKFSLNKKSLTILEYDWTPISNPDNMLFTKMNSALISNDLKASIKEGVCRIMISNVICMDESKNKYKLSKEFVIFIIH